MLAPALTTGTKPGAGQGTRVGGWRVCTIMAVQPVKSHDVQQPVPSPCTATTSHIAIPHIRYGSSQSCHRHGQFKS